jgi:hypothetical protein
MGRSEPPKNSSASTSHARNSYDNQKTQRRMRPERPAVSMLDDARKSSRTRRNAPGMYGNGPEAGAVTARRRPAAPGSPPPGSGRNGLGGEPQPAPERSAKPCCRATRETYPDDRAGPGPLAPGLPLPAGPQGPSAILGIGPCTGGVVRHPPRFLPTRSWDAGVPLRDPWAGGQMSLRMSRERRWVVGQMPQPTELGSRHTAA